MKFLRFLDQSVFSALRFLYQNEYSKDKYHNTNDQNIVFQFFFVDFFTARYIWLIVFGKLPYFKFLWSYWWRYHFKVTKNSVIPTINNPCISKCCIHQTGTACSSSADVTREATLTRTSKFIIFYSVDLKKL